MTVKERFNELRSEYIATADEKRKAEIDAQIRELSEQSPEDFRQAFLEGAENAIAESREFRVKEAIEPVIPALNLSFIAENYFHKSRSWFSQRLNGATVNGKPARFTSEELDVLAYALKDISKKIADINIPIH
jgi:hypothetical protein